MDKAVTLAELKRWAALIKGMPFVYKRTVNGKKYIIVHAGYYEDDSVSFDRLEQFYIYARDEAYTIGGVNGATIIAGHTPTIIKGMPMYTGGEVYRFYDKKKDCTFYDIDCGCGYKGSDRFQNCRLAWYVMEELCEHVYKRYDVVMPYIAEKREEWGKLFTQLWDEAKGDTKEITARYSRLILEEVKKTIIT